jgi:hypothetical protein
VTRTGALVVAVIASTSCWRSSTTGTNEPDEPEAQKTARRDQWGSDDALAQPPTSPPSQLAPGMYVIAGCNTACNGCAIGHSTTVHGVDVASGKELFPHPNMDGGGGISCSAALPLNTHVKLVAKSGDGLVLERWRPFNATDYCPCAGTNNPVCDVTVTQEIAAKFTRAYCGADWKPQGAAQLGH